MTGAAKRAGQVPGVWPAGSVAALPEMPLDVPLPVPGSSLRGGPLPGRGGSPLSEFGPAELLGGGDELEDVGVDEGVDDGLSDVGAEDEVDGEDWVGLDVSDR